MNIVNIEEKHLLDLAKLYEELSGHATNFEKMAESYRHLIENKNYILIGIEENGKIIGTVMAIECLDLSYECKSFMVIENLIVTKSEQNRSAGRMLMKYCEAEAKKRECYYIILVSAGHRKEAHAFYKKLGYDDTGAIGFKKYIR